MGKVSSCVLILFAHLLLKACCHGRGWHRRSCVQYLCFPDPCAVSQHCKAFPQARCITNICGGCIPEYYHDGSKVDCNANPILQVFPPLPTQPPIPQSACPLPYVVSKILHCADLCYRCEAKGQICCTNGCGFECVAPVGTKGTASNAATGDGKVPHTLPTQPTTKPLPGTTRATAPTITTKSTPGTTRTTTSTTTSSTATLPPTPKTLTTRPTSSTRSYSSTTRIATALPTKKTSLSTTTIVKLTSTKKASSTGSVKTTATKTTQQPMTSTSRKMDTNPASPSANTSSPTSTMATTSRPNRCPPVPPGVFGICANLCFNCEDRGLICCSNGCGQACFVPLDLSQNSTTSVP